MIDCQAARAAVTTANRSAIDPPELEAHLASCAECRRVAQNEAATNETLQRMQRRPAPAELRARVAKMLVAPTPRRDPGARRVGFLVAAALFVAFVAFSFLKGRRTSLRTPEGEDAPLVTEAVNDHLRVLVRDHPLDVESSDTHQVKPWFAGRLDFAPIVAFGGDADFPLEGGAVGWFVDRKAATFVYKRRLHVITLLVFRADGLSFATRDLVHVGRVDAHASTARGYHVLLWRDGDLGYALVSDVDPNELQTLAARIAG